MALRSFSSLLALAFLFTSCSSQPPLTGHIHLKPEYNLKPMVYLIAPSTWDAVARSFAGTVLDSATIAADGSFSFGKMPKADSAILLELTLQRNDTPFFANRLEDDDPAVANYCPFVWEPGKKLRISADAGAFQKTFNIENPSPTNEALLQLRDLRLNAFQEYLATHSDGHHHDEELLDTETAHLNYQRALFHFAESTEHLLPALTAIRWVSPQGDYERVAELLVAQAEKWKARHPLHPWVQQLVATANLSNLPLLVGDTIPDYPMPMLNGDTVSLRKMLGSRLTILDLWASWCAPCRKENRNVLLPLWEQYHHMGLQIIGYALDAGHEAWTSAINKDGAYRWLHASHLNGDDAPLLKTLRISTIPANFIVDANGKVLAKNLHGQQLKNWVKEYMEGH